MANESTMKVKNSDSENGSKESILQGFLKKCLFVLTFLLPVFWLPFASSPFEFSKYQLLVLLGSLSFLAWSVKVILKDKKISFNLNLLDLSVLFFLVIGVLSTIFSLDTYISLFGSYGIFSNGLIATLSLGIVYFLIRGMGAKEEGFQVKKLLKIFFTVFFIVLLVSYFSVLGIGKKLNIENISIEQRIFNPISFSLEGLSVFVATVMVLLTGIITCSSLKIKGNFLKILLFSSLFLLVLLDINSAWIVLLAGLSVFTFFALLVGSFKKNINQLLLPIFLIIIAALFLWIDLGTNAFLNFPEEQYLEERFSYDIAFNTVGEGTKEALIGSGLGTWRNDFLKNRPVEFNEESVLWDSRLSKAGNYVSELLATTGVLGTLSYSLLIVFSLYGFFTLEKKKEALPYIAALTAVLASQFVYYQNTALAFLNWFILGLGALAWKDSLSKKFTIQKTLSSDKLPEFNLGFSVVLILLSLTVIGGLYFTTREVIADVYFVKAQQSDNLNTSISHLQKAIEQNPYRISYKTSLIRVYLSQAFEEYGKPDEEQDMMVIQGKINKILEEVEILKEEFSNRVAAWETIGVVRRDIQGSFDEAIEAFQKALELDKKNPTLYTEIGKLYANSGDIEKARENYNKAQELKSNYFNAYLLEALSYEEEDVDQAIKELKKVEERFPTISDTKFQLGRLYYNKDELDLAISYFIEVIQISPNDSNALYYLGLAYEGKDNLETALAAFERVAELNPNNEQVSVKIEEIKEQLEE